VQQAELKKIFIFYAYKYSCRGEKEALVKKKKATTKYCPFTGGPCLKEDCAFWDDDKNSCLIRLTLSEVLASRERWKTELPQILEMEK
jgi:hypothetical protein